jgi:anti-sigma factor RsiW
MPSAAAQASALRRPTRRILSAVVAAGLCGVAFLILFRPDSTDALLVRQVRDSHVRSLLAAHLYDVESSDQHTVKPWFAGRLDFAPWVSNLADEGFRLLGGRLEYFDNRPVAALVFKRRDHVINLLTWPEAKAAANGPHLDRLEGHQIVHWSAGGMTYWAVSDLNAAELQDFATLVQSRANLPEPNGAAPAQQSPTGPATDPDHR